MKWSLFNWKKPVVSSGEPEDYQVVKNTVSQNERNITNINNQLANTVSTNTAQTITGAKTFNEGITINKNPIPLLLKATSNDKNYIVFRDSANNSNLSIGANATSTSIEVNRGDLTIQTQQTNKTVAFETGTIKTNRARLEFGTEINAGFGGGVVKFIPEDNSTKTLQFFNANANDTRRFNLKINEPTEATNPATKQYVDTQVSSINDNIRRMGNDIEEIDNKVIALSEIILKRDYTFTSTNSTPALLGETYQYTLAITDLQETMVVGVNVNFKDQSNAQGKAEYWNVSWTTKWGPTIYIKLFVDRYIYNGQGSSIMNIDFSKFNVRVFYIPQYNSRESEKLYQGEILTLPDIEGGK